MTSPITIDGYSAPGYDLPDPDATPVVNISGSAIPGNATGLFLGTGADGSMLRGLAVHSIPGNGITVSAIASQGPADVAIQGCHVGIRRGAFYLGNAGHGIRVFDSGPVTIGKSCDGGSCLGRGNVISSNGGSGVSVMSDSVQIAGNLIGTSIQGHATFVPFGGLTPNGDWGVRIDTGALNTVGGFPAASSNLISGNIAGGVLVSSNSNLIVSNKIGTNLDGDGALPNEGRGRAPRPERAIRSVRLA